MGIYASPNVGHDPHTARSSFLTASALFSTMSRALTSAQVIEKGDYLKPDFDPATLTVAQLLGVFGFHNINYPSPYTKGKLVQIFSDEITNKTAKLSKERLHRQNSQASDDGITDGVTGKPINEGRKVCTIPYGRLRSSTHGYRRLLSLGAHLGGHRGHRLRL